MPDQAPLPQLPRTRRKIGIELEFDACGTALRLPEPIPSGWHSKPDGSLHNGIEVISEPALDLNETLPRVQELDRAFNSARTNTGQRGGFHVHVQSHDVSIDDCWRLVQIYRHFQPIINKLVAESRHNNTFCRPYAADVTKESVIRMFNLDQLDAPSRASAKGSRQFSVVNLAMMRCRNPQERSIEFRQGSISKRTENIWGWSVFVTALVELSKDAGLTRLALRGQPTLENLCLVLNSLAALVGGSSLSEWVRWRYEYLNAPATDELVDRAIAACARPHGIFHISRQLDINLALTKRLIAKAVDEGKLRHNQGTQRYQAVSQATYDAAADVRALREAADACTCPACAPAPLAATPTVEAATPTVEAAAPTVEAATPTVEAATPVGIIQDMRATFQDLETTEERRRRLRRDAQRRYRARRRVLSSQANHLALSGHRLQDVQEGEEV